MSPATLSEPPKLISGLSPFSFDACWEGYSTVIDSAW